MITDSEEDIWIPYSSWLVAEHYHCHQPTSTTKISLAGRSRLWWACGHKRRSTGSHQQAWRVQVWERRRDPYGLWRIYQPGGASIKLKVFGSSSHFLRSLRVLPKHIILNYLESWRSWKKFASNKGFATQRHLLKLQTTTMPWLQNLPLSLHLIFKMYFIFFLFQDKIRAETDFKAVGPTYVQDLMHSLHIIVCHVCLTHRINSSMQFLASMLIHPTSMSDISNKCFLQDRCAAETPVNKAPSDKLRSIIYRHLLRFKNRSLRASPCLLKKLPSSH